MYPRMYQRRNLPQPRPRGFELGYLLIGLLSISSVFGSAYGVQVLTNLPFITGLLLISILCMTKMYFLRYQPVFEQAIHSGWDRIVGYAVTTFFSIASAAFGLFCLSVSQAGSNGTTAETHGVYEGGDIGCTLGNFLSKTLNQDTTALGCWIVPLILEVSILMLVLHNRPRYPPYHYIE